MKISMDNAKSIREAVNALRTAQSDLSDGIASYNSETTEAFSKLREAIDKYNSFVQDSYDTNVRGALESYNGALDDLKSVVAEAGQTMRDEWEDKSERWQESEAGRDADDRIREFENYDPRADDLDEPEEVQVDELVDMLEPEEDGQEALELIGG